MKRLLIGLAVAVVFLALTFTVVSCEPGEGPEDSPGIEVDIDAPGKHKTKHKPAYKAPKYGKGRR